MKKEDRELLLRDLCARLPYKVKVYGNYNNGDRIVDDKKIEVLDLSSLDWFVNGIDIKPYLRQMYSMTEEERKEYYSTQSEYTHRIYPDSADFSRHTEYSWTAKTIDWLNAHHFDYRGLIPRGLAIEASKDMYNEIKEE